MKIEQRTGRQIEWTLISEARPVRRTPVRAYRQRRQQALWWFREMHRVVDATLNGSSTAVARGEQRSLSLAGGS